MTTNPAKPQTPEDDSAYYRAVLHDLIDRGADLARRIHESATAATPTPENRPENHPPIDPSVAFDRIARAIRRTIALARRIAETPAAQPGAQPGAQPTPAPAARTTARTRIIRGVKDAIDIKKRSDKTTDAEALYAELNERLDDPELERELETRPIDDIIADIARDLGVARQSRAFLWKRRTPGDIAALRARAAAPPAALHLIQGGKPPTPPPAGPTRQSGPGSG